MAVCCCGRPRHRGKSSSHTEQCEKGSQVPLFIDEDDVERVWRGFCELNCPIFNYGNTLCGDPVGVTDADFIT